LTHSSKGEKDAEAVAVAKKILRYFLDNPGAADSLDGIARWRLMEEMVQQSVAATESGLSWLVSQGYLEKKALPGSRQVFHLNPQRQREAEQFLDEETPEKSGDPQNHCSK